MLIRKFFSYWNWTNFLLLTFLFRPSKILKILEGLFFSNLANDSMLYSISIEWALFILFTFHFKAYSDVHWRKSCQIVISGDLLMLQNVLNSIAIYVLLNMDKPPDCWLEHLLCFPRWHELPIICTRILRYILLIC